MVNVTRIDRKSVVLSPSSLACLAHIPAVNLTSGCAHDCLYCYARGYSVFPGENKVVVYKNTLDKLKRELAHKRTKPQAVYFSPSSDIFQPVSEVIELGYSVLEFLLASGIGIAILTKGFIPNETFKLLLTYPNKVRVQIGIITADDTLRSIFEPNAASISTRLEQMTKLVQCGIVTEARVIPILPGITDEHGSIDQLLSTIASTGVKRVAISTLFLRPAITASLKRRITDNNIFENLLGQFKSEKRLAVHAENSSIIPLSRLKREEIYTRFGQVAKKYALDLSICGCMNPDIGGTCNITGEWPANDTQSSMF
ncbi:MAG: radical SAM protein [Dehalococcoidales bacterium]|nr:radical SAM protein [Dehalococcoidales bacterium]